MIHRFADNSKAFNRVSADTQIDFRTDIEKRNPQIQTYDPQSEDIAFAQKQANELINISGADVWVFARTENTHDEVFEEDPDPTYRSGKLLKGFFAPQKLDIEQTKYGIDAPNKLQIVFSRQFIFEEFKERMIRIGDLIEIPYNGTVLKPLRYEVINAYDSGNFKYTWLYYTVETSSVSNDTQIDISHR